MTSTTSSRDGTESTPPWRGSRLRYHTLGFSYRRTFGQPVWKISVDGRFDCPNVDGTIATGGCVYCNIRSFSPSRRRQTASVTEQIEQGVARLSRRYRAERFIAYFQPATNTHGAIEQVKAMCEEALCHPAIVGLILGTRPDCVPDAVLDLMAELSRRTWFSVEYGLQTIHDRTLEWIGRGHRYEAFEDAVVRSHQRDLRVGAHVILGLPGESRGEMRATAAELARLRIDSVKLHNLYVVRETRLAEQFAAGEIKLPDRETYVQYVVDFLERLPPECVIDRLSGDAPPEFLIAPQWCRDKSALRAAVEAELERRDTWQGCRP